MKDFTHNFRGRLYRVKFTSKLPEDTLGECDPPDVPNKEIRILPCLAGRKLLETVIDESIHACNFDLDNEVVGEYSNSIGRFLWKLGYRMHTELSKEAIEDYIKVGQLFAKVDNAYTQYTEVVDDESWVISREVARLLALVCRLTKPSRILDLGAGFSSIVLRMAADNPDNVVTVDTEPEWLRTTQEFLDNMGLLRGKFILWKSLRVVPDSYNMIFVDIRTTPFRMRVIPKIMPMLSGGGTIILDDMNKRKYRTSALSILADFGIRIIDIAKITRDKSGRFAVLGRKEEE